MTRDEIRDEILQGVDELRMTDFGEIADGRWADQLTLDASTGSLSILAAGEDPAALDEHSRSLAVIPAGTVPDSVADAVLAAAPKIEEMVIEYQGGAEASAWEAWRPGIIEDRLAYYCTPDEYYEEATHIIRDLARAGYAAKDIRAELGTGEGGVKCHPDAALRYLEAASEAASERYCHGCDSPLPSHAPERVVYCGRCGGI